MPTYRLADLSPAEQARIAAADDAERDRAALLRVAQAQAQAIGRMAGTMRELREDVTALERENAKMRHYCAALERRLSAEQRAAAVAEASAAVAEFGGADKK